jgi:hypothetical protein
MSRLLKRAREYKAGERWRQWDVARRRRVGTRPSPVHQWLHVTHQPVMWASLMVPDRAKCNEAREVLIRARIPRLYVCVLGGGGA